MEKYNFMNQIFYNNYIKYFITIISLFNYIDFKLCYAQSVSHSKIENNYFEVFENKYEISTNSLPIDETYKISDMTEDVKKIEGIKNIMEYTVNPAYYDHFLTSKFTFCEYLNEYTFTKNDVSERIKIFLQNSPVKFKFSEISNFNSAEFIGYKSIGHAKEKREKVFIVFYFMQDLNNKTTGFINITLLADKNYISDCDEMAKSVRSTK